MRLEPFKFAESSDAATARRRLSDHQICSPMRRAYPPSGPPNLNVGEGAPFARGGWAVATADGQIGRSSRAGFVGTNSWDEFGETGGLAGEPCLTVCPCRPGRIGDDQMADWARRIALGEDEARRALASVG